LRTAISGNHRGRWREYADGTGGDMLDLVAAVRFGGDLRQAIPWARGWLGQTEDRPAKPTRNKAPSPAARYETLSRFGRRVWAETLIVRTDTPAGRYLAERGCALPHQGGHLRWHPELRHPNGYVGPALVALVTDVRDPERWLTLHRTWIGTDGRKADVETPRLLLAGHPKAGGVIRLWPDDWVTAGLGIAEGIETTLTLARGFTPAWSVIDAANLAAFPVLAGIEALTVAVDHDAAGLKAFKTVAERWHAAGREVRKVLVPSPGADLNDWARSVDHA
jgi:putative DNA primase/helicase